VQGGALGRRALLRGAAAGCAALALPGCGGGVAMTPQGWSNALGTAYTLPRWKWAPTSAADLVTAVRRASAEGRRIRMTGSGHSFSDVALNDDWLLSPLGLVCPLPVDTGTLRADAQPETLFRVQSGCTVHALNAALDARGLALPNMGAADVQTYVGAASTGTHGSGLAYGPLASQIVSIQVVGPRGTMLQVEPEGGITDRARFTGRLLEAPDVRVELVRKTHLFDALAVGLGSLGVIYAVTLRATKKFWLIERRTYTTWECLAQPGGVVDRIVAGEPIWPVVPDQAPLGAGPGFPDRSHEPEHVEINYSPYPGADAGKTHVAMLTQRWRCDTPPPGVGGERGSLLFSVGTELSVLADHLGILPAFEPKTTDKIQRFHATAMKQMAQPYYANPSHDVFTVGAIDDLHVYGIELHFDLAKTRAAVARNLEIAGKLADEGIHHSSPPTLRFIGPAQALLAMQNGRKTVSMEFGVFTGAYGAEELLRSYETAFVGGEYGGRPHWGLDRNYLKSAAAVKALYPDTWGPFLDALGELNPDGTFDGAVTDRLGISRSMRGG
jgi:hypothetical protein